MISTAHRVTANTSQEINHRIQMDIAQRVRHYASHPDDIPGRLRELDEEWDIERAIEANASALAFAGVALGAASDRRWLILPVLVTTFLFQHAIQGWCPPVPILRQLGFRTVHEIETERNALKALRGDYESVSTSSDKAAAAFRAVHA